MSKVIVTVKSDTAALPANVRRAIGKAQRAVAGLEPSTARIVAAVRAVGVLAVEFGMSSRAVQFHTGTSKGTAARLHTVATRAATLPDFGDSNDAIIGALFSIGHYGNAADVTRAADLGGKAEDGDAAYAAVSAVLAEVKQAEVKALTADVKRPTGGETADGGKGGDTDADDTDETPTTNVKHALAADAFASLSLTRMIETLTARVAAAGTVDAAILDAFATLAATVETAAAAADVTA